MLGGLQDRRCLFYIAQKGTSNVRREVRMRAMLCSCKDRLVASDNEKLFGVVLDHLRYYHPVVTLGTDRIRGLVGARSYEFNEVVGVGANPEEEFGIDPF